MSNRLSQRRANLKWRYGITPEQYDALLAEQGGRCALCGDPPRPVERFVIDHDHACCSGLKTCGRCIRGLVHRGCNSQLALVERVGLEHLRRYLNQANDALWQDMLRRSGLI